MATFDGKYLNSYLIFAKIIKYQKFDFENEGQDQGLEYQVLRHLTRNVRIHVDEFLQNFSYPETLVYEKMIYTHTHMHSEIQR